MIPLLCVCVCGRKYFQNLQVFGQAGEGGGMRGRGGVRPSCCPIFDAVLREKTQQQLEQPDLRPAPGSQPMEKGRDGRTIMARALQHLFINHSSDVEWR